MISRIACLGLLAFTFTSLRADNWPGWRGPTSDGVASGKKYPLKWSETENVLWKVPLPGGSGSTPAVWGDRIFVTTSHKGKNQIQCFNLEGKPLWKKSVGKERKGKHRKGAGCNPSPTTDGRHVFCYFKSGDLAALTVEGEVVWQQNLQEKYGEDTLWWDLGTSPVLTRDFVVVAVMHSGPSFLLALDKATGKEVWKEPRDLGAPSEAAQSYSTPLVLERDGKEIIVVLGADHVTSHDAATGKRRWLVGDMNPEQNKYFRSIASPVVTGNTVVAPYARGDSLTAISMGGSGDVTGSHVRWTGEISADVPTPAARGNRVYVLTDKGVLACIAVDSGKVIWKERIAKGRAAYSASPILTEDRIYVTREDGTTFVLARGDSYELLATNEIDEYTLASPVLIDGKILLKTYEHLYCIGSE